MTKQLSAATKAGPPIRAMRTIALIVAAGLTLAGCGGDGSNSVFVTNGVSGQVVKGVVSGARVTVYDAAGSPVDRAETVTGLDGRYAIEFAAPVRGPIEVRVEGVTGTLALCDVADGCEYRVADLALTAPFGTTYPLTSLMMRAVLADVPAAGAGTPQAVANVSPLTEMAAALASANGVLTAASITAANAMLRTQLQNLLGEGTITVTPGIQMTNIAVPDLTNLSADTTLLDSEHLAAALFAAMTAAMVESDAASGAGNTQNEVFARLANDLVSAGTFAESTRLDIATALNGPLVKLRTDLIGLALTSGLDLGPATEVLGNLPATTITVALTPDRLPLPGTGDAAGTALISFDQMTGSVAIEATFEQAAPTRVELRTGYPGEIGEGLLTLQDAGDGRWITPSGATLDAGALEAFAAGRVHLLAATTAAPAGLLRGFVPADNITVLSAGLRSDVLPSVPVTPGVGQIYITVDQRDDENLIWRFRGNTDIANVTRFTVRSGEAGTDGEVLFELLPDASNPGVWSADRTTGLGELVSARTAARLFVEARADDGVLLRGHVLQDNAAIHNARLQQPDCTSSCDAGVSVLTLFDSGEYYLNVYSNEPDTPALGFRNGAGEFLPLADLISTGTNTWRAAGTLGARELARFATSQLEVTTASADTEPARSIFGNAAAAGLTVDASLVQGEVNGVVSGAGSGSVTLISPGEEGQGFAEVFVTGLTATQVQIRHAIAGRDGSLVWVLEPDLVQAGRWDASLTFTSAQTQQLRAGELYLLVSTADFPNGALRAQLIAPGFATLFINAASPDQVVPPSAASGDSRASLTLTADNQIAVSFRSENTTYQAVRLHQAAAGAAGLPVSALERNGSNDALWTLDGLQLSAELASALRSARLYVEAISNLGSTRAQFLPADVTLLRGLLTGTAVVPPAPAPAPASAALTLRGNSAEFNLTLSQTPASVVVRSGAAGHTGVQIAALAPVASTPGLWRAATFLDPDELAMAHASALYIETINPDGRAQLAATDDLVVIAGINAQQQPGSTSTASGIAAITAQGDSHAYNLVVRLDGSAEAGSITLNVGPAGVSGDAIATLSADDDGVWSAAGTLTAAQAGLLARGELYVFVTNVTGTALLRGQLVPITTPVAGMSIP